MKVTGIVVHVVDLVEALGSAPRAADLLGQQVAELVRWAAVSPWLLGLVQEDLQGAAILDGAAFAGVTFLGPFATVADAVSRAAEDGHPLAAFGPSLAWCTADHLRLLGVKEPPPQQRRPDSVR